MSQIYYADKVLYPVHPKREAFYREHSKFKLLSSSPFRKLLELIQVILTDIWNTRACAGREIEMEESTRNGKLKEINGRNGNEEAGFSQLKYQKMIAPSAIELVSEHYLKTHFLETKGIKLELVQNFMCDLSTAKLPNLKNEETQVVLIPIVLKGFPLDHIVGVIFNKETNTLEYYDSKGLTIKDRANQKVRCVEGDSLLDAIEAIVEKYGNVDTQVRENRAKHQQDIHSCGVYVLDFFERRLSGVSFQDIENHGLTFEEVNNSVREHFLKQFIDKPLNDNNEIV